MQVRVFRDAEDCKFHWAPLLELRTTPARSPSMRLCLVYSSDRRRYLRDLCGILRLRELANLNPGAVSR
jgi:hypothetical protein